MTKDEFTHDWIKHMGKYRALTTETVTEYLNKREGETRRKVVAELRSSAFLHCDVNKEDVLLAIEHGIDWPKFKINATL